jgi:hypothetical protein
MEIRFTKSARKHRIGKARVLLALQNAHTVLPLPAMGPDARTMHYGTDDRGLDLEIVTIQLPDYLLVIHAMPSKYRE